MLNRIRLHDALPANTLYGEVRQCTSTKQGAATHHLCVEVSAPAWHNCGSGLAVVIALGRAREEGYAPVVPVLQHDARRRLRSMAEVRPFWLHAAD